MFDFRKLKEYMDSNIENQLSSTDLEAIQNIASMFNNGKVILPNLEVLDDSVNMKSTSSFLLRVDHLGLYPF